MVIFGVPQQDILRAYHEKFAEVSNVGLELPTGTGKTTVGLLIGEWKRRKGQRVAYLCLTNQLVGQVIDEAQRLGIVCARSPWHKEYAESGGKKRNIKQHSAIGVTTFSNLWNINPVVKGAGVSDPG